MDLNQGLMAPPDRDQDAARRRMAAKLLEPETMPGQISSPGAARGLALASALKNAAGVALQPQKPTAQQPAAQQPAGQIPAGQIPAGQSDSGWGQVGQWFSSLFNRGS